MDEAGFYVEVLPEYRAALKGIERFSHIHQVLTNRRLAAYRIGAVIGRTVWKNQGTLTGKQKLWIQKVRNRKSFSGGGVWNFKGRP